MIPIWKKVRTLLWISSGFFAKQKRVMLFSGLIGIAGFVFITRILPLLPQAKPTVRIGRVGSFAWESLPKSIYGRMSQGLTQVASDGSAAPALAEKWEVSEDGKNYTFTLRDSLYWMDGVKLKASDIHYSFDDVTIEAPDDKTIKFQLKDSFAPFPVIMSLPVFKENYVGVGPYQLRQIKKNGEAIDQLILDGKKKNIIYKFYPTISQATKAFKLGEIDVLEDVFEVPFEKDWEKTLRITKEVRNDRYVAAFFNNQDPWLGDKKLRQALAYAAKKDFGLPRAMSPINPSSWAYNPDVKPYEYDPDKAKSLFEAFLTEGQESTKSAAPAKDKNQISLKISTTQHLLALAEQLKRSWEEVLDIKVQIETVNALPTTFQILLIGQEIPLDPDQYPLWHSTQAQNFTHYQSPKVDKLLEDARRILDQSKRKERYLDFQRFLVEDSPVLFLYHPETFTVSRRFVETKD